MHFSMYACKYIQHLLDHCNLQVVVMQSYKNNSSVAIEAKYVFPLGDMAAGETMILNGFIILN